MFTKNDKKDIANPGDITNTKAAEAKQEKTSAVEKITQKEQDIASATLVGDLRDKVLGIVRTQQKPWQQLTEAQQKETVDLVVKQCTDLVQKAVKIIAANGRHSMRAKLEHISIKKLIEGKITVHNTKENRDLLGDASGLDILLVTSDATQFEGERKGVDIQPDQADLERDIVKKSSNAKTSNSAA